MARSGRGRAALALIIATAMGGCSADAGVAPAFPPLDLTTAEDLAIVDAYSGAYDVSIVDFPRTTDFTTCVVDSVAVVLRCNFTGEFHATITSLDMAGHAQFQFDSLTTQTIAYDATLRLAQEIAVPSRGFDGTSLGSLHYVGRRSSPTERWTWSGSRTDTLAVDVSTFPEYSVVRSTSVNNVMTGSGYPLSGSIVRTGTVTVLSGPGHPAVHQFESTLSFDGTEFPLLTIGGHSFHADLKTGAVTVIN